MKSGGLVAQSAAEVLDYAEATLWGVARAPVGQDGQHVTEANRAITIHIGVGALPVGKNGQHITKATDGVVIDVTGAWIWTGATAAA